MNEKEKEMYLLTNRVIKLENEMPDKAVAYLFQEQIDLFKGRFLAAEKNLKEREQKERENLNAIRSLVKRVKELEETMIRVKEDAFDTRQKIFGLESNAKIKRNKLLLTSLKEFLTSFTSDKCPLAECPEHKVEHFTPGNDTLDQPTFKINK